MKYNLIRYFRDEADNLLELEKSKKKSIIQFSSVQFSRSVVSDSLQPHGQPMDSSLPGSIHGIFQARILEWVAISYSRGSS